MPPTHVNEVEKLAQMVLRRQDGQRQLIAICGAPGSGKSTLVEVLNNTINAHAEGSCAIVPMDGFHFDDAVLRERDLLHRKGAPETFDIDGLIHLHRRLSDNQDQSVAVPLFDRDNELSRAAARIIPRSVQTVLIEGNYLLLDQPGWLQLAPFYTLTIQLDVPLHELKRRLMERWDEQGLSFQEAQTKVQGNDMPNAKLVLAQSRAPDIVYAAHNTLTDTR
jgi:pantothenate kinase